MTTVADCAEALLVEVLSEITRRSVIGRLGELGKRPVASLSGEERRQVLEQLTLAVRLFARGDKDALSRALAEALPDAAAGVPKGPAVVAGVAESCSEIEIRGEDDIAQARGEAWSQAVRLGLSRFSSVKVATAVSELARNIVFYAGRGIISLEVVADAEGPALRLVARDQGPGISAQKLAALGDGSYRSERGLGQGLSAVRRLADSFELLTSPGVGTTVRCSFRAQS